MSAAHPRLRGEHRAQYLIWVRAYGSSPLTRGARLYPIIKQRLQRLIPAYAGST